MRTIVVGLLLAGCGAPQAPVAPPSPPPAASTTCYAGTSTGFKRERNRTIVRRTVDPAAGTIVHDTLHAAHDDIPERRFRVVMNVQGDRFTIAEEGGAFRGTGLLIGEPWRWSAWNASLQMKTSGVVVDANDELTPTGMQAVKLVKKDNQLLGTLRDNLESMDCAKWDTMVAALSAPPVDRPACERACRNVATLRFRARAEGEVAALPADQQAAAKSEREAAFVSLLEKELSHCVEPCLASNNAAQTACFNKATTSAESTACE